MPSKMPFTALQMMGVSDMDTCTAIRVRHSLWSAQSALNSGDAGLQKVAQELIQAITIFINASIRHDHLGRQLTLTRVWQARTAYENANACLIKVARARRDALCGSLEEVGD